MNREPLVTLREAVASDADAISRIYNPYVRETAISFEEEEVSPADIAQRMRDVAAAGLPWLVAAREGEVVGYAYATKWRARSAYRFSVEVSVYVDAAARGAGIGATLYEALFAALRERGIHSAIAGIALPNEASIALHERFGMKKVAQFEQVGLKFGRWIDVGYWQRVF